MLDASCTKSSCGGTDRSVCGKLLFMETIVLEPSTNAGRTQRLGFWLFFSMAVAASSVAVFGSEPEFDRGDRIAMLLPAVIGFVVAYRMHRLGRRSVCRYRCDSDSIQRESVQHYESVRWSGRDALLHQRLELELRASGEKVTVKAGAER